LSNVKDGDFILCRTNAPLVSLALQMISDGQKAVVKGVDIGKKLITNLKSTNRTDVKEAIKVLWSRYELLKQEMEGSFEMKSKLTLMNMEDMILATVSLAQGCKTIEDVHEKINKVFSDNTNAGIILSTAHKSKGLEANNIHIIKPQLMPLKHLDLAWEKIQEENLHYVAITRAKMNLFYIND
jgi:superfamily I DNA/RNA helicase